MGEFQAESTEASNTSVQVSPEGLELFLIAQDPWRYSRDQIVSLLRDSGYLGPLDELGIDALSRGENVGKPTRVICGNAAVAGSDEEFFYHFDSLKPREKAAAAAGEREAFAIDHRESRKIDRCDVGDVLVRIIRERDPVQGVDAWGRVLEAPHGKDLKLQPGQNVTLGTEGRSLISAISGVPIREPNGRISVSRSLVVQTVDFKSGNIHFDGSVSVEGDVTAGFVVEASGDVEVKGSIEHGTVKAGGSITIKGGVRRQSQIFAVGAIEVRFVDSESRLEARATVTVAHDAIQSELIGDEGVFVGGQLVGGVARSAMHIQVTSLGCPRDTPTRAIIERPLTAAKILSFKEELGLVAPQDRSGPSAEDIAAQGNLLLRLGTTARVVSARPVSAVKRALAAPGVPSIARPPSTPPGPNPGSQAPRMPGSSVAPPSARPMPPGSSGAPPAGLRQSLSPAGVPRMANPASERPPESTQHPASERGAPLSTRPMAAPPPSSRPMAPLSTTAPAGLSTRMPVAAPGMPRPGPMAMPVVPATRVPAGNPAMARSGLGGPGGPGGPPGSVVAPARPTTLGMGGAVGIGARPGMPPIRMPGAPGVASHGPTTIPAAMPTSSVRLGAPKPLGSATMLGGRIGITQAAIALPRGVGAAAGVSLVTSQIAQLAKLATIALYDQIAILPPNANGRIVATTTVRPGVTLMIMQVTRAVDMPTGPRAFRMEESLIIDTIIGPAG